MVGREVIPQALPRTEKRHLLVVGEGEDVVLHLVGEGEPQLPLPEERLRHGWVQQGLLDTRLSEERSSPPLDVPCRLHRHENHTLVRKSGGSSQRSESPPGRP